MKRSLSIINPVITFLSVGGISIISAGLTPIKRPGEIEELSQQVNYTQPPGFIFAIWGIIYIGFILFSITRLNKENLVNSKFSSATGLITISIALNLLWIVLAGIQWIVAAYLLQWIMLFIAIITMLDVRKSTGVFKSILERTSYGIMGMYAGWLTVAMIPFTTDLLLQTGWNGEPFNPKVWAIAIYLIATIIVALAYRAIRVIGYVVPLAWAFFGFFISFDGLVGTFAGILSLLVTCMILLAAFGRTLSGDATH